MQVKPAIHQNERSDFRIPSNAEITVIAIDFSRYERPQSFWLTRVIELTRVSGGAVLLRRRAGATSGREVESFQVRVQLELYARQAPCQAEKVKSIFFKDLKNAHDFDSAKSNW